jgi:hypothetical protein
MVTPNLNNHKGLNRNRSVVNTNNINKSNPTGIKDSKIPNIKDDEINSKKLKSSKTKDRQE